MKNKISRKRGGGKAGGGWKSRKKFVSLDEDSFFDLRKRRKYGNGEDDGEIHSDDSSEDGDLEAGQNGEPEEDELEKETAGEKRQRLARACLEKFRAMVERELTDKDDEEEEEGEKEGLRDSMVSKLLQQEQLEETGRSRRKIASWVQKPETGDTFRLLVNHHQSVTAVALSEDDSRGFSASKDGTILHWDVTSGKCENYKWPIGPILKSHGLKDPQGRSSKHSKQILALAASSDGRYLATGGLDRHIHLWDTRTREHIQAFSGHEGPVSCLTFRQGTAELFSGSLRRTIKIWNCDNRDKIDELCGHQSEVLAIDCLRKERVLSVGRDRTMQLYKVPEGSTLVFRAPASSSLESCCFINNSEYLTGSDDGSIQLWSMLRKKPVSIVKNAHPFAATTNQVNDGFIPNDQIENGGENHEKSQFSTAINSWVSSVSVCRGSDLAASGAGNGYVRLWNLGSEGSKEVQPLFDLPLAGFVNSIAVAKSGKFIVAGVGQEPRLGRWGRVSGVKNGVAIHSLKLAKSKQQ